MDIGQALNIISAAIKIRTDELAAFQTASDILSDTFRAEFSSLDVAVEEANQNAIGMQAAKNDVSAISAERDNLKSQVADLVSQVNEVKKPADGVEASTQDIEP